jgi:hypothetical protein
VVQIGTGTRADSEGAGFDPPETKVFGFRVLGSWVSRREIMFWVLDGLMGVTRGRGDWRHQRPGGGEGRVARGGSWRRDARREPAAEPCAPMDGMAGDVDARWPGAGACRE